MNLNNDANTIEILLAKKYDIRTHSIALIDHDKVDVIGIPLTEINGECYENHAVVITVKFRVEKILGLLKNNIPFSIMFKSKLPEFIKDMEDLISMLNNRRSLNQTARIIYLHKDSPYTLEDLVELYNTLVVNNKKIVRNEMTKDMVDSFELVPLDRVVENRVYNVNVGETFVDELDRNRRFVGPKKSYGELRDGY